MGIRAIMLTGDNPRTAAAVARGLDLDYRAQLMPQDKQRIVNEYRDKGEVVLKVGDGINDAPAFAAADIGVAMGGGTDVALETADAAVLHGRVSDVPAPAPQHNPLVFLQRFISTLNSASNFF